jgi:hypothetical protein
VSVLFELAIKKWLETTMPSATVSSMADDPLADFLKRQAEQLAIRPAPPSPRTPPTQRLNITRLHLTFGELLRLVLPMTAASLVIGMGLWAVPDHFFA